MTPRNMKKTPIKEKGEVRDKSLYMMDEAMILQVVKMTKFVGTTSTELKFERDLFKKWI